MKKVLMMTVMAVFAVACTNQYTSSANRQISYNNSESKAYRRASSKQNDSKYKIIDQEFDNMLAPESDYDTLSAYELQACGDSYLPPADLVKKGKKKGASAAKKKSSKTASKVTKNKKVVNNVNVHYIDGPAPVPVGTISSSTTTTTTTSSSSSYAGGNSYSSGSTYSSSGESYQKSY